MGYSPQGRKESATTERLHLTSSGTIVLSQETPNLSTDAFYSNSSVHLLSRFLFYITEIILYIYFVIFSFWLFI